MPDYPKEQLWELYKNLPKDLQKAAFSKEVAANIQEICSKNEITDDDLIFDIAKNIGYVFLGLLPPNEFSDVLEKELKIEKSKAGQIASEITRFVFLPVKKSLEALYKIKIKPGVKPKVTSLPPETELPKKKPKKGDKYRETIE
ncbi:hypothetical protein KJA13_04025 [Patescibacteria group bacterium]|nr:hypothetical protein [Patescibacteria group bacterium]